MRGPAARAVVRGGRLRARHREIGDEIQQRLVQLGEIGGLGGPVVHLRVDVQRPVRTPRRAHVFVPDALQVRRLRARAAARDQQVAAVLEQQLDQPRVFRAVRGDPFVGRLVRARRGATLKGTQLASSCRSTRSSSVRVSAMCASRSAVHDFVRVGVERGGCERSRGSRAGSVGERSKPLKLVAAATSTIASVAPATCRPSRSMRAWPPPFSVTSSMRGESHSGIRAGVVVDHGLVAIVVVRIDVRRCASVQHAACSKLSRAVAERRREPRAERQEAGTIGREAQRDDLIRMAGDRFAGVGDAADRILHRRDARAEIQRAAIAAADVAVREGDVEIAERQIRLRVGAERLLRERVGFDVLARGDQAAQFRQDLLRLRVVPILRAARPERVFVQLEAFAADAAEDHGAEAAVADRKCFHPARCGTPIPERQRAVLRSRSQRKPTARLSAPRHSNPMRGRRAWRRPTR